MVRGVFVNRATSHRHSLSKVLDRHFSEVTPTKCATTAYRERSRVATLKRSLDKFSLVALTPEVIARCRDERFEAGKSASSVRLELALLSNLYTIAMREWRLGLTQSGESRAQAVTTPPRAAVAK
jgi:hypothetical protein